MNSGLRIKNLQVSLDSRAPDRGRTEDFQDLREFCPISILTGAPLGTTAPKFVRVFLGEGINK